MVRYDDSSVLHDLKKGKIVVETDHILVYPVTSVLISSRTSSLPNSLPPNTIMLRLGYSV